MTNNFIKAMKAQKINSFVKGGPGSGNFGHAGRDAENLRGGSARSDRAAIQHRQNVDIVEREILEPKRQREAALKKPYDKYEEVVAVAKEYAKGKTLSIFINTETKQYHIFDNTQVANIDPFSDEYKFISRINPPKMKKPDSPQFQDQLPDRFKTVNPKQ